MVSTDVVLEVRCPASVYQTLRAEGFDKETLSQEARKGLAVRLYGEHRLSLGMAAELAGLPIVGLMDLLRALQIPVVEYGEEEYAQDLETIAHLTQPGQGAR
jgi:predicted HTH domain antitoxin